MNSIIPKLPKSAIVRGELYDTIDLAYLTQDILEIELPGEVFIDVAWWPPKDRSGSFVISVFKDEWENQLGQQYFTKDLGDLVKKLERLAEAYSSPVATYYNMKPNQMTVSSSQAVDKEWGEPVDRACVHA